MRKFKLLIILLCVTITFVLAREEKTISKIFDGKEIIKIYTVSGDCIIEKSKNSKIYVDVTYTFDPKRYVPEFIEDSNSIKIKEKFKGRGSSRGKSLWKIKIPERLKVVFNSASGDLKILDLALTLDSNTASGDFELNDIIGDIDISTASGDLKLNSLKGKLNSRSASGDLKIKNVIGDISYKSASGDFRGDKLNGNIKSKSASGDIDLKMIEGSVNTKTASGDIKIKKVFIKGESSFKSASGDINIKLSKSCKYNINISTASGDAILDYNGNTMEGFFSLTTKKSNDDDISAPFNFTNTEVYNKWGKKMITKTATLKNKYPKIKISSYSGSIKVIK